MKTINISSLRKDIYNVIDQLETTNEPICVTGRRSNAVLVSENDWNAVIETLYLSQNADLKHSIVEGLNTSIEDCDDKVEWQ